MVTMHRDVKRFLRELVILAIGAAVFSGVYALLDLLIHGSVRW